MIDTRGWRDPVVFRQRMDNATRALVGLSPDDFPDRLRGRATMVLGVRSRVAQEYVTDTLFHFERLTPKQREALTRDLIALYEGCLMDLGAMGHDYVYPADRNPP